jgi:hypothetical protein
MKPLFSQLNIIFNHMGYIRQLKINYILMKANILINLLIVFIIILSSCEERDDFSKISKDYPYKAEYAFPVGNTSLDLDQMGIALPTGWQQYPEILGLLDSIVFMDDFPFEIKSFSTDINYINKLIFKVITTNQFPSSIHLRIFMSDQFKQVIDTIGYTIKIEPVKADGDSVINVSDLTVEKNELQNWLDVKYMVVYCVMENDVSNEEFYKNYSKYRVKAEIGLRLFLDFNFKDVNQWQTK